MQIFLFTTLSEIVSFINFLKNTILLTALQLINSSLSCLFGFVCLLSKFLLLLILERQKGEEKEGESIDVKQKR